VFVRRVGPQSSRQLGAQIQLIRAASCGCSPTRALKPCYSTNQPKRNHAIAILLTAPTAHLSTSNTCIIKLNNQRSLASSKGKLSPPSNHGGGEKNDRSFQ
jgi:hypothetical protein